MKKLTSLFLLGLATTLFTACSGEKETEVASQEVLFNASQTYLQDENYFKAIQYLEALNTRFPRSMTSEQTQLDLIYAYYQDQEYDKALIAGDNFFRHYKHSPHADYVLYMSGLARETQNKNFFQDFFGRDPANRDSFSMRSALDNFAVLVKAFPNSPYSQDARERMEYIYALLARHELNIAKFYATRKAWVAVANRIVSLQHRYPNTSASLESLPLLKTAYQALNLPKLVAETEQLIQANAGKHFPEHKESGEPKNILPPKVAGNSNFLYL